MKAVVMYMSRICSCFRIIGAYMPINDLNLRQDVYMRWLVQSIGTSGTEV